jgi:hypothetical protein
MAKESRPSFSSSSEIAEGAYFKMGGTATMTLDRWTRQMHKSSRDKKVLEEGHGSP